MPQNSQRLKRSFEPELNSSRNRHSGRRVNGNCGGFTLIELLIAVVIGSIIIASLYATFFSVIGAGSGAGDRLDRTIIAGRFLDRFSRDIEGAYFDSNKTYTGLYGTITGTSSVMLVSTYTYPVISGTGPVSDLVKVRYHIEESKDGTGYAIYRETSNPFLEGAGKFDVELIGSIESLKISYLLGNAWTGVWDSARNNSLPKAVRVELALKNGELLTGFYRTRIR